MEDQQDNRLVRLQRKTKVPAPPKTLKVRRVKTTKVPALKKTTESNDVTTLKTAPTLDGDSSAKSVPSNVALGISNTHDSDKQSFYKQDVRYTRVGNLPEDSTLEPVVDELERADSIIRVDPSITHPVSLFNSFANFKQGIVFE